MIPDNIFNEEPNPRYKSINQHIFKQLSIIDKMEFFKTLAHAPYDIYKNDIVWMGSHIISELWSEIEELHTK